MSSKFKQFKQGIYKPLNSKKCLNTTPVEYRSKMEFRLMRICDKNPKVLEWSSEHVVIPYKHPIKDKVCRYFVDMYIKLQTPTGVKDFLVEVKPFSQTQQPKPGRKKQTTVVYEATQYIINTAKWEAARQYAKNNNMEFILISEKELKAMELL